MPILATRSRRAGDRATSSRSAMPTTWPARRLARGRTRRMSASALTMSSATWASGKPARARRTRSPAGRAAPRTARVAPISGCRPARTTSASRCRLVAPGQPSRGRAERVGRGPDRPAQPHGQQHQGGQHHQGGAQGQGLGGLIGPVLAAGIGPLRLGQLVLQGRLAGPQLLEVAVGVAGGDGPGGRPGPALPRLPLGLPGPDPGPVLGRHLLHQREQAPPAAAQLLDPVETLGGADLGLVAGAQEDGRPPRHHQHAEQDGELHPQAPHP